MATSPWEPVATTARSAPAMAKLLSFSDESRAYLERGVNALADAVKVTIGP